MSTHTIEKGSKKAPEGYPNKYLISDIEAYKILKMHGCPIKLPRARSMMQAGMDLDALKPSLFQWYNSQQLNN